MTVRTMDTYLTPKRRLEIPMLVPARGGIACKQPHAVRVKAPDSRDMLVQPISGTSHCTILHEMRYMVKKQLLFHL